MSAQTLAKAGRNPEAIEKLKAASRARHEQATAMPSVRCRECWTNWTGNVIEHDPALRRNRGLAHERTIFCARLQQCRVYTIDMPKYSIVVPFHNEEENVTVLYARLKQVMEQVGDSFELVLVDDGSSDRTYKLLEEIAAVDSRVLVVKLRRNFGQTSALAAGFDHSSGEFILVDGRRPAARSRTRFRVSWRSWKRAMTWCRAGARSASTTS